MSCPLSQAVAGLRRTRTEHYYHPATGGFIPSDEVHGTMECGPSREEAAAADLMERLARYLSHDIGCPANDLDHLDDSPCTCGLRKIYNPKGV